MSLLYYSRMRMIDQLLPLLTARASSDDPAHIISVYAGGAETWGSLHKDDLSLRKDYSFSGARTHVVHMKTMFFEHLANDHPGKLSLVHVFPGLVITPAFAPQLSRPSMPWWVRMLAPIMLPILKLTIAVPTVESGQRTLSFATARYPAKSLDRSQSTKPLTTALSNDYPIATATNGMLGGGAYSCEAKCETNKGLDKAYAKLRAEQFYDRVWSHTYGAFNTIAAGNVFQN